MHLAAVGNRVRSDELSKSHPWGSFTLPSIFSALTLPFRPNPTEPSALCNWIPPQRTVNIYDRNGRLFNEIMLPDIEVIEEVKSKKGQVKAHITNSEDPCAELRWDSAGQKLAILPSSCSICVIWIAKTQEVVKLDTNMKVRSRRILPPFFCSSPFSSLPYPFSPSPLLSFHPFFCLSALLHLFYSSCCTYSSFAPTSSSYLPALSSPYFPPDSA